MRCSIIRRVSTEEQSKKISLAEQLRLCQQSITTRNWEFVRDFNFEHTHGYAMQSHPLYSELKYHLARNECDVLITAVLDRTLRDTAFWLDLCQHLQQHQKVLATPAQVYDPSNLEQELFLNIAASIGHFERKKIKERARMGLNALKDQGKWTGGTPPLGYTYDPAQKKVIVNPPEAHLVNFIFDTILNLNNKIKACELINAQGHRQRSGENWTPRAIRRLLEKPRLLFYAGRRLNSRGEDVPATWEGIIDMSKYNQILTVKKSRYIAWKNAPAYLLTGLKIFYCGYCNLSVKTNRNRKRSNTVYYYCSGYQRGRNYCQNSRCVRMLTIDNLIQQDLIEKILHFDTILEGYAALDQQADAYITEIQKSLSDLRHRQNNLIMAIETNVITHADAAQRMHVLKSQIQTAEIELRHAAPPPLLDQASVSSLQTQIPQLREYTLAHQREIISLLITRITLYSDHLEIEYKFPVTISGARKSVLTFEKKA